LRGFDQVFGVAFVINGQLLAGMNAILRVSSDLLPDFRGPCMFATALGHQRKFAPRLGPEFRRQPDFQGLRARGLGAITVSAPLQKS